MVKLYGKALKCRWESKMNSKNEIRKKKTELRQLDNEVAYAWLRSSWLSNASLLTKPQTIGKLGLQVEKSPFALDGSAVCSVVNIEVYFVKRRKTNKNANAREREWYSL